MLKSLLAKAVLALAVSASMLPVAASAGEVQNRINRQQARLNQGVASGQITRREYNRIDSRDASIEAQRDRDLARNGGHLTPREYRNLNGRLNNVSRSEYFDKHNLSHQPGAPTI